ncbi:MAG: GGDEF domain-containing protein [Acidimicrobiales bacterium]|nr:GGDEF domain-containing protein [Acidimicrobiales bacterium]
MTKASRRNLVYIVLVVSLGLSFTLWPTKIVYGAPTTAGQVPSGGSLPSQPSTSSQDQAIIAISTEADILAANKSFSSSNIPQSFIDFTNATHLAPNSSQNYFSSFSASADQGLQELSAYLSESPKAAREVILCLQIPATISQANFASNQLSPLTAQAYIYAIDDLILRGGRPPQSGVQNPDGTQLAQYVNALVSSNSVTTTPTLPGSGTSKSTTTISVGVASVVPAPSGLSSLVMILIGLLVLLIMLILFWLFIRRRNHSKPTKPNIPTNINDLFELSRQITNAEDPGEVLRIALREARNLTSSTGAAYVNIEDGIYRIEISSPIDMLATESLGKGIIARVAETAQPISMVSATEPSIRSLPAAFMAVPVVNSGKVQGVLIVVRDASLPFGEKERELLNAVAPVTAAALSSANRTKALSEASLKDPLTGVGNRRKMDADLLSMSSDGKHFPLSAIMIDLDHFKNVNDTWGHEGGDLLLKGIAKTLSQSIRPQDKLYRYGGEEFCVLLPATSPQEVLEIGRRICESVRESKFALENNHTLKATASLGVSTIERLKQEGLIANADAALYSAKESGRDQVIAFWEM